MVSRRPGKTLQGPGLSLCLILSKLDSNTEILKLMKVSAPEAGEWWLFLQPTNPLYNLDKFLPEQEVEQWELLETLR